MIKKSKVCLYYCIIVYLLAYWATFFALDSKQYYVQFFFADVVATIIVWIS